MKSFFKDVFKRMAVTLVSTILLVLFSVFLFQSVISSFFQEQKEEPIEGSFLVLDLSMNVTDRPSGLDLEDLTREALTNERKPPNFHLREIILAIKKAATDPSIRGIFIEGGFMPDGYGCGYGAIKELLFTIESFKESGKQVIGFYSDPTQLDYLVYSICDELHMNPSGTLILNGLANEQIFLAEAFEKYGVGIQVVRVGEFKGAVEPFTSTAFSDENRLQISRLLDLRWDDYLDTISRNRGLGESELKVLLDQNFLLSPEVCKQVGLVDQVSSYGEMLDRLKTLGKEDRDTEEFARVKLIDYVDRPLSSSDIEGKEENKGAQIAVVYVEGAIMDGMGDDGVSVGGGEIAKRIREVSKDDSFKGLVLRVNSPGGSVSGSDAILSEITRIKEKGIPVIVSMGAVAASGGYWISMDSDKIFAGEQTITGSIGVFGLIPNLKKMAEGFGIHWDVVKTHASADIMSVSRAKSDLELEVLKNHVERIYDQFLNLVSENRDLNVTRISEIAQGRVWMGVDAYELGLVDELGGLEDAIKFAAETAGVAEYKVTEFPKVKNSFDLLEDVLQVKYNNQRVARVSTSWEDIFEETKFFMNQVRHFNDPRNSYSLLPWYRGRFGF